MLCIAQKLNVFIFLLYRLFHTNETSLKTHNSYLLLYLLFFIYLLVIFLVRIIISSSKESCKRLNLLKRLQNFLTSLQLLNSLTSLASNKWSSKLLNLCTLSLSLILSGLCPSNCCFTLFLWLFQDTQLSKLFIHITHPFHCGELGLYNFPNNLILPLSNFDSRINRYAQSNEHSVG